jgi:hypothetical protein
MLKALLIALFLGASSGVVLAQSQEPSPTAAPEGQPEKTPPKDGQQQSQTNQRGTDESPLVVKVQNTKKTQTEAEQEPEYQQRRAADRDAFNIGIAAIVVGALQTVALFVTFLIISSVGIRQLRAWVQPESMTIRKFSLTEPIIIAINFKNTGATPARDFHTHGVVWVGALPLPDNSKMAKPNEHPIGRHSRGALFPGVVRTSDYVSDDILTPEITKALKEPNPKRAIYVAAEAFYRDVFSRRRMTQVCWYLHREDAAIMIAAEESNAVINEMRVRFASAHVLNRFT